MLKVSAKPPSTISLSGAIDGTEDFSFLFAGLASHTTVDCGAVTQINSTGIKAWIRFFASPETRKLRLKFENFSVALVEQLNMFKNFVGEAPVLSFALPFRCATCNHNFSKFLKVAETGRFRAGGGSVPCEKCGQPAQFDDLPEEYFEFLGA